ncbi:MAG TPA: alkaline phosphatase D family protein, partial [Bacteroidales bacterium]|nr:alkaline phosphatase D family protein [Bacteroidales bacterium]
EKNGKIHTGGPMLGNISPHGVNVWIRTLFPAPVEIQVKNEGKLQTFGPVGSSAESDLTAIVKVSGLNPNTKYSYRVLVDGEPLNPGTEKFFVTPPEYDQPAKTKIAFGSCYHRWGLCNQRLSEQIRSREPLAMLLNGDMAAQDRNNNIAMHRVDYLLRDFHMAWKKLAATIPVYATWDDHDYFDNDLYNIPEGYTKEDKEAVSDIFRTSWNNPAYGTGKDGHGVFFRTRIGPADVIMLDNRYFREEGNYLGDEQMEWLEEQLLDCEGPFIILSNGTMFSDYVSNGKDSWGRFDPEGREKIFNLIEKNNIGGVLLISGDRHGARGFKIPRPSGFNFYEFGAASLGGRVGPPPIRAAWDTQLYGISGEYAFGEFSFDTTLPDPEVTFRLIHESGTIFHELTLTRSQLTP